MRMAGLSNRTVVVVEERPAIERSGQGREQPSALAAERANRGHKERLQTIQTLTARAKERMAEVDRAAGSHLEIADVRNRLLEVRTEIVEGLDRGDPYWGKLTPDTVLGFVDQAVDGSILVRSGSYNLAVGVETERRQDDHHRQWVALEFGRARAGDDGVPRPREGVVRPADAMIQAAHLDVEVPKVWFYMVGAQTVRGTTIEVHEWIKGQNLEEAYPSARDRPPYGRPIPETIREMAADTLVRLASQTPSELLAKYPDAPKTCGKAHEQDLKYLEDLEATHWPRWAPVYDRCGLAARLLDTHGGGLPRWRHPAPDLPTRLVQGDQKRGNWMLEGKKRLVLIDFDAARLGDPGEDLAAAGLYMLRTEKAWRQFLDRYERGLQEVDPQMATLLPERIRLFAEERCYRALLNLPAHVDLALSSASPETAPQIRRQQAKRVEETLRFCQPFLGNEIISGEEFLAEVENLSSGDRAGSA